jgi:hypothetical protein
MTLGKKYQEFTIFLAISPDYMEDGICLAARGSDLRFSDDSGKTWELLMNP